MSMNTAVFIGVKMFADDLDDKELAACYNAATSGWTISPDTLGYEKFAPLLQSDGRMHQATIDALSVIVNKRLSGGAA